MADNGSEWHDPLCTLALQPSLRTPAGGKYLPKASQPLVECICKDLRERRSTRNSPSPSPLKSSLKSPVHGGSNDDLGQRDGESIVPDVDIASAVRRRRPRFDTKALPKAWPATPVTDVKVLDIVESLIRLSILSALLFSAETQSNVPISKMAPPSNMMRILGEGEASLLEEAARQSHHDFVVGVKSYVRLLPSEEIYDRMMNASTLVSLPRSLKWQITRYNRALANHDALSLKKERDERHRLIVDRRRLQDEYQALRRLEECVIELQRDEQLHSSILVTLNVQLDLLVPDFSTLNNLLKTKEVVETLNEAFPLLSAAQMPLRLPHPHRTPSPHRHFHQKWVHLQKSEYNRCPSRLKFILQHRLSNVIFVLLVLWRASLADAWFISILHNYSRPQMSALSSTELTHVSGFLYWLAFDLCLLFIQFFIPFYRILLNYEQPKSDRAMRLFAWTFMLAFICLLVLAMSVGMYAAYCLGKEDLLTGVGNWLASASLFRQGNGVLVLLGLLYEEYVVVGNFEG